MMIIVRNTNDVFQIAKFNIDDNDVKYSKVNDNKLDETVGDFEILDNILISLFVHEGENYLRVDNKDYVLNELKIMYKSKFGKSELTIINKEIIIANLKYKINFNLKDFFFSFFDFGSPVEIEDLDYGLFVFNISQSTERQKIRKDQC